MSTRESTAARMAREEVEHERKVAQCQAEGHTEGIVKRYVIACSRCGARLAVRDEFG